MKTASQAKSRVLIVRFSSFGDIVQTLSTPEALREPLPDSKIDWLVRSDFRGLLTSHPLIDEVISFERKAGVFGLIRLVWQLGSRHYTHVYDAHNNVRSKIVVGILALRAILTFSRLPSFVTRPKNRLKRWLFFNFRIKTLPMPFRGSQSFLWPLKAWGLQNFEIATQRFFPSKEPLHADLEVQLTALPRPWVAVAASAAWEMKRWPIEYWKDVFAQMPEAGFILLGGPEDHFLNQIQQYAPTRAVNLAGKLSLAQSSAFLERCDLVIANDTGLLHVADQLNRPTVALIGPTAFGYPSHPKSLTAEIGLWCKPCSKDGSGGCKNDLYKRCLVELSPEHVVKSAKEAMK